jgi:hypothetical protein
LPGNFLAHHARPNIGSRPSITRPCDVLAAHAPLATHGSEINGVPANGFDQIGGHIPVLQTHSYVK